MRTNYLIIRIVLSAWLAGWFIKAYFFIPYLLKEIWQHPVEHPLFPPVFVDPLTAQIFYFLPVVGLLAVIFPRDFILRAISLICLICSVVLMMHLDMYNDATFVTSFWTALWMAWFIFNIQRTDEAFYWHACGLAQMIVGIIFLGGLIGKFTSQYWTGDVVRDIFFRERQGGFFWSISYQLNEQQQKILPVILSWGILLSEFILALSVIFPIRFYSIFSILVMGMVMIFSTWRILSVLACLMGLMVACFIMAKRLQNSQG